MILQTGQHVRVHLPCTICATVHRYPATVHGIVLGRKDRRPVHVTFGAIVCAALDYTKCVDGETHGWVCYANVVEVDAITALGDLLLAGL